MQGTLSPRFKIVAHSRLLSSLHMHPKLPLLLSTSQDGTLVVWRLPDSASEEVGVALSKTCKNCMLVGGTFVGDSPQVAVSTYSSEELHIFTF